ncbi:MAG: hypothetical protein CAK88_00425 [Verrucomicrobiia bacterium AMD-G2]|nr:MAG: hypothetical protein CAK88_00425 [Verrucomicrobiae bacterium AMD-G2]
MPCKGIFFHKFHERREIGEKIRIGGRGVKELHKDNCNGLSLPPREQQLWTCAAASPAFRLVWQQCLAVIANRFVRSLSNFILLRE